MKSLQTLTKKLLDAEVIAFDTETTSTDQMEAELVGISLAVEKNEGYYIPVGHQTGKQLDIAVVLDAVRDPLTDSTIY